MATAVIFRQKAEQCRRLANAFSNSNEPAVGSLKALAIEFDAKATTIEAETAAALSIGCGDDIGDPSTGSDTDAGPKR